MWQNLGDLEIKVNYLMFNLELSQFNSYLKRPMFKKKLTCRPTN